MLDKLQERLNELDGKIASVRAEDTEAIVKDKVATYEAEVRQELEADKAKRIGELSNLKLGIKYLIDLEAQELAEKQAADVEAKEAAICYEAGNIEEG